MEDIRLSQDRVQTLLNFLRNELAPSWPKQAPELRAHTAELEGNFLVALGYSEDEVARDYPIWWKDAPLTVTAATGSIESRPRLLVRAIAISPLLGMLLKATTMNYAKALRSSLADHYVILTSTYVLVIDRDKDWPSGMTEIGLDGIDEGGSRRLLDLLGRPDVMPTVDSDAEDYEILALGDLEYYNFAINLPTYRKNLRATLKEEDRNRKGVLLEDLAVELLEGLKYIRVRRRNLRTISSEIDIVCSIESDRGNTFYTCLGRYFIVECKNWSGPADKNAIVAFKDKMAAARVEFGLLFSRRGITGTKSGTDATAAIRSAWDRSGLVIIVIGEQHLRQVAQGRDFFTMLEGLYEARRFDTRGEPPPA